MGKGELKDLQGGQPLSTVIFNRIRENILNKKYIEGEKLGENKLAEELGVSRTPIREALKKLELYGLVENIPNRGVFVRGFNKRDIEDIFTIRSAIEGIAAKWAVERINDEELEALQETYELMEFYTAKKEPMKVAETNIKFHEIIYNATKSRYLEQVLKDFQFYMKKTRKASLNVEGRMKEALEEHKKILDAFYEKDLEKVEEAITKHLQNSQRKAEEAMLVQD